MRQSIEKSVVCVCVWKCACGPGHRIMCTCDGECVDVLMSKWKIGGKIFTGENSNCDRVKIQSRASKNCITVQAANVMHGAGSRSSSLLWWLVIHLAMENVCDLKLNNVTHSLIYILNCTTSILVTNNICIYIAIAAKYAHTHTERCKAQQR